VIDDFGSLGRVWRSRAGRNRVDVYSGRLPAGEAFQVRWTCQHNANPCSLIRLFICSITLRHSTDGHVRQSVLRRFVSCTVASFSGILLCLALAKLLSENRAIRLCGQFSESIMTWHLLLFALIGALIVSDHHDLIVFQTYNSQYLWPIYPAVSVPISLNLIWRAITPKGRAKNRQVIS
jgi:hypothetical protein